jgi:hypothetical protein
MKYSSLLILIALVVTTATRKNDTILRKFNRN